MNDLKKPNLDHPVQDVVAQRWSPYVFAQRSMEPDDVMSVFEAARWAASAFNEQPWRFMVATRDNPDQFTKMLSSLVEPNQAWAQNAAVLALGLTRTVFTRNGNPNSTAVHDLGLASANLTVEATARGLAVHQMSGILPDLARETFQIPEEFEVVTALAIGYPGEPSGELGLRDKAPRSRRPLQETLFAGPFGQAFEIDSNPKQK